MKNDRTKEGSKMIGGRRRKKEGSMMIGPRRRDYSL